jgi:hypothetical protein
LLKGCQFADNQFQALQNQEIESFSVHGFRLPELEAEVVQIQPFCTAFSLLLDFSESTGFGTWRIFVPLFWVTCRLFSTFLLFWIIERFFSVDFIYSIYPCQVETSRGSILLMWSFYTMFTLCPFETKRGSICLIWTGIVFLTGQVIFVPEWPKWEFVSFCVGCILLDKITIMYCY